jgi:hypothetical protein
MELGIAISMTAEIMASLQPGSIVDINLLVFSDVSHQSVMRGKGRMPEVITSQWLAAKQGWGYVRRYKEGLRFGKCVQRDSWSYR